MAFVQSPFYHMLPYTLDPSSSSSSSSINNNNNSNSFSDASSNSSNSSLEEQEDDELSAMFQSDSFSLESNRDRDLKSLGNLLELSLGSSNNRGNNNFYEADDNTKSHFGGSMSMGGYNDSSSFASSSKSMYESFNTQQQQQLPHSSYLFSNSSQYQPSPFSQPSQGGAQQHQSTPHVTPQFMTTPLPSISNNSNEFDNSSYPSQLSSSSSINTTYKSGEIYVGRSTHSYSLSNPQQYNYTSATPSSSYTTPSPFSNFSGNTNINFGNGCRAPNASRERSRSDSLPSYQQSELFQQIDLVAGAGSGDYEMED